MADEEFINKEMNEIQRAIDEEREAAHGNSYKALLKNGEQKFFYRTMLGIGGQFMQQVWMDSMFFPPLVERAAPHTTMANHQ